MGQSLVDRIEFEEFGLKSFDPSFGPSISQLKRSPVLDEKQGMVCPTYSLIVCSLISTDHNVHSIFYPNTVRGIIRACLLHSTPDTQT